MAFGLGPMEVLLLIAMGGGSVGADFVSFLPAETYFQSRNIPVNVESMVEAAGRDPKDAKTQITQLLALRTLAERPDLVTSAKNKDEILKTLHKIAKGELAKDKHGFAPEYAARALDRPPVERAVTMATSGSAAAACAFALSSSASAWRRRA